MPLRSRNVPKRRFEPVDVPFPSNLLETRRLRNRVSVYNLSDALTIARPWMKAVSSAERPLERFLHFERVSWCVVLSSEMAFLYFFPEPHQQGAVLPSLRFSLNLLGISSLSAVCFPALQAGDRTAVDMEERIRGESETCSSTEEADSSGPYFGRLGHEEEYLISVFLGELEASCRRAAPSSRTDDLSHVLRAPAFSGCVESPGQGPSAGMSGWSAFNSRRARSA